MHTKSCGDMQVMLDSHFSLHVQHEQQLSNTAAHEKGTLRAQGGLQWPERGHFACRCLTLSDQLSDCVLDLVMRYSHSFMLSR